MSSPEPSPPQRADAVASRERILAAAAQLSGDRRLTMAELAAAAGVGRSTLYRHFPTRADLEAVLSRSPDLPAPLEQPVPEPAQNVATLAPLPPGRLGRATGTALDVTHILDEVPPHLIADQLVAEARRAAGVAVALYVVDLDGSQLIRLAGSDDFPEILLAPPAIGPEIVPEGLPGFYAALRETLPRAGAAPLWLRGRVVGLLLCVGASVVPLEDIAKQGALALELAGDYTDLVETVRRRKPTSAAAEVQLALLPPRIARVTGAQVACGLLPSYEVGGDWFDHAENRDGVWLGIADAGGTGPAAAGASAALLGALRSARRQGLDLLDAVERMDAVVRALPGTLPVTALLARWRAASGTLEWISCGHPIGYRVDPEDGIVALDGPEHPALGTDGYHSGWVRTQTRLEGGERLLLLTNGILDRTVEGGRRFGLDGVRSALQAAPGATAPGTIMAIQQALTRRWTEPLQDDATSLVLAVD